MRGVCFLVIVSADTAQIHLTILGARTSIYSSFFLKDPSPPEISPLPLPDALPILLADLARALRHERVHVAGAVVPIDHVAAQRDPFTRLVSGLFTQLALRAVEGRLALFEVARSEEHTSELQSQSNLVCRLLLEQKH